MKRDSGILVAVGTVFLAVVCCVGLPLIAAAVAAVGVGALLGGLGVAALVAVVAGIVLTIRLRQRA